jgi:hypothetical protein
MALAATPLEAAPAPPAPPRSSDTSPPPRAVSGARPETSSTPPAVSDTPTAASGASASGRSEGVLRPVSVLAVVGGALLSGIGFTGSYTALKTLALKVGMGSFAYAFPVGVDAGIVVLLALDILMIRRGKPWPALRFLAHLFTVATIVFNASSGKHSVLEDPLGAAVHGIVPLTFIASVEAGRRLILHITALEAGQESTQVPLYRWLLAPRQTFGMWRRMKLWNASSYAEAVRRRQDLAVYTVMLKRKHGNLRKLPEKQQHLLLPMKMEPYGLTVDEALALPQQQEERDQRRREAAEDLRLAEQKRAKERTAELERTNLLADGSVQTARHEVEGQNAQAQAQARAATAAVERQAQAETQAQETADMAAAKAAAAASEREAQEDRLAAARTAREAAEEEERAAKARQAADQATAAAELEAAAIETKDAAEARRAAAEIADHAAEIERRAANAKKETAEAEADTQKAERQKAQDEQATAEARQAAAEARRDAAEIEDRALEMEAAAKLTPRERIARRVARMILARGGDIDALPLEALVVEFGVSTSTASAYRTEAGALLASGYNATQAPA